MEAGEPMQQFPSTATPELFSLEGVERLVVPSQTTTKSYIPFGMEGTSAIISPYGEILRMSQHVVGENPRIICLTGPTLQGYQRDLRRGVGNMLHRQAQVRGTGLGINTTSASGAKESSLETRLEWLNGHWPCICYEFDGLAISVMFTVEKGVLSQQYVIVNPSEKEIVIRINLQIVDSEVYTLQVKDAQWVGHRDSELSPEQPSVLSDTSGFFHIAEREPRKTREISPREDDHAKNVVRGEAVIAVFHNGTAVIPDGTFPNPVPDGDEDTDDGSGPRGKRSLDSSKSLQVKPKGVERLVLQYRLQSQGSQDTRVLEYLDVDNFLKSDSFGNWSFQQHNNFNPIFRRHLEHILHVCLINVEPNSDQQSQFAFISDFTFESGSSSVNDFYIFRYLLFMYHILETNEHIRPIPDPTNQDTTSANSGKRILQDRIKEACEGHLLWSFGKDVLLANQSWPSSKVKDGTDQSDNKFSRQQFQGSLQMIKLFEFAKIFKNEGLIVSQCLRNGAESWLEALTRTRDEKSELWYKDTKKAYVAWEGHRGEGSEWLDLPEYRLRDLVYTWKALKCLEEMIYNCEDIFASKILRRLEETKLRHSYVRKIILQHFLYQDFEAGIPHTPLQSAPRDVDNLSEETESNTGSFAIAVRRTRERDRLLFYAKDTMLHDGFEWGFFDDNLDLEILSTNNKLTKANVHLSWRNTLQAQGADREPIWEKPLRYALAIIMARYASLDNSMSPEELERLSWERLLICVAPHGLFADRIEWDTKLPEMMYFSCSESSHWEIPTLLLRRHFETLEFAFFRDPPQVSSSSKQYQNASYEQKAPQTSDNVISQDTKVALKKSVVLEKKRTRSNKKPNMEMVSDPIDRKMKAWLYPFPDFITTRPPYGPMQEEIIRLDRSLRIDLNSRTNDGLLEDLGAILKRGVERWKSFKGWRGAKESFSGFAFSAILVDIGKHRRNEPDLEWCDAQELDWELCQARSVEKAKKRFHYLGPLQVEHALIIYLATPIYDRRNMAQFYTRHASFSSHFHEDVHPLADVWAAELHLGFLQLVDTQKRTGTEHYADNDNVCDGRQRKFPHIVKGSHFDIYKASLGYRFVGDMGDRFWSGWLLTYVPGDSRVLGHLDRPLFPENVVQWFDEKTKNDQRRILEPFLVGNMVAEVWQSTDKILRQVDQWLDPEIDYSMSKEGSKELNISKADDQDFGIQYNQSSTCLELEAILGMLLRLSKANVESLFHWLDREESRHYKPRWSEKDELNHAEQVDHQKRRAEQQIFLLDDQHRQIETSIDQIRAHRQELMDNLNLTQSRTAALNAENVRIFTYATVIFYPLSFVASLFSMQGPPNHSTTSLFIQATAIALVITLVIVFNAEILAWPFRRLRFSISLNAREKMGETSNMFPVSWQKTLNRIKEVEEQDVLHDIEMPKWPRSKLIYLLFLVVYFLVEFPASRIMLAYESVVRIGGRTPGSVAITAVQISVAMMMLPLFVVVWMGLVTWSILHSILSKIWALREIREKVDKSLLEEAVAEYVEEEEKSKEQDGGNETDRKRASVATLEEKSKRDKELKERVIERKAQIKEKVEETRRVAHKEKQDRLQKYIALLINPPRLYEAKTKGFISKTKDEDQKTTIARIGTAASSLGKDEATTETPDQSASLEKQILTRRSIWHLARRLKKKAIDDEVRVAGLDEQTSTAEHAQIV